MIETNEVKAALERAEREGRIVSGLRLPAIRHVELASGPATIVCHPDTPLIGEPEKKFELLPAGFEPLPVPTWTIPLRVTCGDNSLRSIRARTGRAGHERTACTRVFAQCHISFATLLWHFDPDRPDAKLKVTLCRLGGRMMDYSNVVSALKYVQDVTAAWLGMDDRDKRIVWAYDQKPGGPYGVQVQVEKV